MANFWDNADELKYKIHSSLSREFKTHPRAGWIRGDIINVDELLEQYNSLKKEHEDLQKKVNTEKSKNVIKINDLKREFTIDYNVWDEENEKYDSTNYEIKTNLYDIIVWCGAKIIHRIPMSQFKIILNEAIVETEANDGEIEKVECMITDYSLDEIKLKLLAFGLAHVQKFGQYSEEEISLSSTGEQVLYYTVKNEEFYWYIDSNIK